MPKILAKSWSRFVTSNFCVTPEVMGCVHEFGFENHCVSVKIPGPERSARDGRYDSVATVDSWRADTEEILSYRVHKVDVEIAVREALSVPQEALSSPCLDRDLLSEEQKNAAQGICSRHAFLADKAFHYWLETIRWVSGDALIGQYRVEGIDSGWPTLLVDSRQGHRVWSNPIVINFNVGVALTLEHWMAAAEHLSNGDELPMHLRFLHDAMASKASGYFQKAIIEIAMACEIYIRYAVFKFIPQNTPPKIAIYIEEANINKYVGQFFKSLVCATQLSDYKRVAGEISSLMDKRNRYLHMGHLEGADDALCRRFIQAAKALFEIKLGESV
jgi:hypothetical protein